MAERIDVTPALHAVQIVIDNGTESEQGFEFQGFTAQSDNDGYNVSLARENVHLAIGFHNAYQLQSPNDAATERFIDAIKSLLQGEKKGWVSH